MRTIILAFLYILSFNIAYCQSEELLEYILDFDKHLQKGDYSTALEYALKGKERCKIEYGQDHEMYGAMLSELGGLYFELGEYSKSIELFEQSLLILERKLGKESEFYGVGLNNLAVVYQTTGDYFQAIALIEESLDIIEKKVGKKNIAVNYALPLLNLGILYKSIGEYEKALTLSKESLAINQEILGKETKESIAPYASMAALYALKGEYEEALNAYNQAKTIAAKTIGINHSDYAKIVFNQSQLYEELGDNEKGLNLLKEALSVYEKCLGKNHILYAKTLKELAISTYDIEDNTNTLSMLEESLNIIEEALGKEHIDYANALRSIGWYHYQIDSYEKAFELYNEVLRITDNTLGKKHLAYAYRLNDLAIVYKVQGEYEKALSLYQEASDLIENNLGKTHSDFGMILGNQALLYQQSGDYKKAFSYFYEDYQLNQFLINKQFGFMINTEKEKYINNEIEDDLNDMLSFAFEANRLVSEVSELCYDLALFRKGMLLENSLKLEQSIKSEGTIEDKQIYTDWKSMKMILNAQYSLPKSDRIKEVDSLAKETDYLERELVKRSAVFEAYNENKKINWQSIRSQLEADEAAIEIVNFSVSSNSNQDSVMYAALLISKNIEQPVWINLFEESKLSLLTKNTGQRKLDYVDQIYSFNDRGAQMVSEVTDLKSLVWDPMEPYLEDITTIYYSPAGLLHRINISAIPVNEEEVLGDIFDIHLLTSTRQILNEDKFQLPQEVTLYGGIAYDFTDSLLAYENLDGTYNAAADTELFAQFQSRSLDQGSWNYLKNTAKEAEKIKELLLTGNVEVQFFDGLHATEESLKETSSPKVLHIATHGYFFPDPEEDLTSGRNSFIYAEQPLLRSGLILAGANYVWEGNTPFPNREDGILTALEIADLDLSNTKLAVLSACETGLGDIDGNEGVFGLQRAFKQAGVDYIIMSLWQVPDYQTQDLMVTFYTNWIEEKMDIPTAFKTAQLEMRDKYQNPYFWAGFVLLK